MRLCNACGLHFRKKHYCVYCFEIYKDVYELEIDTKKWICCSHCKCWCHLECAECANHTFFDATGVPLPKDNNVAKQQQQQQTPNYKDINLQMHSPNKLFPISYTAGNQIIEEKFFCCKRCLSHKSALLKSLRQMKLMQNAPQNTAPASHPVQTTMYSQMASSSYLPAAPQNSLGKQFEETAEYNQRGNNYTSYPSYSFHQNQPQSQQHQLSYYPAPQNQQVYYNNGLERTSYDANGSYERDVAAYQRMPQSSMGMQTAQFNFQDYGMPEYEASQEQAEENNQVGSYYDYQGSYNNGGMSFNDSYEQTQPQSQGGLLPSIQELQSDANFEKFNQLPAINAPQDFDHFNAQPQRVALPSIKALLSSIDGFDRKKGPQFN